MNSDAFSILKKNNLSGPKCYSWEDLSSMKDSNKLIYLRYDSNYSHRNNVVTLVEFNSRKDILREEFEKKELLYIEEVYDCIYGGVTLVKKDFVYTEIVEGHPISLLRNGLCAGRFISTDKSTYFSQTYQRFQARRESSSYIWAPSQLIQAKNLLPVIETVAQKLTNKIENDLLLEWFFTRQGLIFCDARSKGFELFGNSLLNLRSERMTTAYQGAKFRNESPTNIDQFSVDHIIPNGHGNRFFCCNSSLLSHFITRNLNINNSVIISLNKKIQHV